jgi:hypothetical protein
MPIQLVDVTASFPANPLAPRGEMLQPVFPGEVVITQYVLGQLWIQGSRWPEAIRNVSISADLWAHTHKSQILWLATIVFMNDDMENTSFGFGKTFRVNFPDDVYDTSHDDELRELLRASLLD